MKRAEMFAPKTSYAMTHDEIAAQLGMTHQGVSYLEKSALKKCRHICERRGVNFSELIDRLKVGDAWEAVE